MMNPAHRRRAARVKAAAAAAVIAVAGLAVGATSASSASTTARAARTLTLNESGRLQRTGSHGLRLDERGTASGTIHGSIYIHLNVSSQHSVSAEVSIYPSHGSLTGIGHASYHVVGGYASFVGTLAVTRGTGTYAHVHASSLRFTGTIQRSNDAVTVKLSGAMSY